MRISKNLMDQTQAKGEVSAGLCKANRELHPNMQGSQLSSAAYGIFRSSKVNSTLRSFLLRPSQVQAGPGVLLYIPSDEPGGGGPCRSA